LAAFGFAAELLNGAITRLLDPDAVLRGKIPEFVGRGELGLASGQQPDGTFTRVWWNELVSPDEIAFDGDVFLLTKARAKALKAAPESPSGQERVGTGSSAESEESVVASDLESAGPLPGDVAPAAKRTLRVSGSVPPEVWNRLGTRLIPKLKSGGDLRPEINATFTVDASSASSVKKDLEQALTDLGLSDRLDVDLE
jgi:hypothetical protein